MVDFFNLSKVNNRFYSELDGRYETVRNAMKRWGVNG